MMLCGREGRMGESKRGWACIERMKLFRNSMKSTEAQRQMSLNDREEKVCKRRRVGVRLKIRRKQDQQIEMRWENTSLTNGRQENKKKKKKREEGDAFLESQLGGHKENETPYLRWSSLKASLDVYVNHYYHRLLPDVWCEYCSACSKQPIE